MCKVSVLDVPLGWVALQGIAAVRGHETQLVSDYNGSCQAAAATHVPILARPTEFSNSTSSIVIPGKHISTVTTSR